jgi:hypothetical protein
MAREKGIVFSYDRFSSKKQEKGDSIRRQTTAAKEWAERNGMRLDARTYADLGLSGFHAEHLKNPDLGGLATFLRAVERKSLPSGPVYLVVENLDRLTRQDNVPALHLFTGILQAGVRIVQLTPSEVVYTDKSPMHEIMFVAGQRDRPGRDEAVEEEAGERAAEPAPGPRGAGEDAAVVGRVAGGEVAEGAEQVGDRPPAGGEYGPDQQGREPLVRRAGEVEGEDLDEGVRLGW